MADFKVLFLDTETTGLCDMRTPYNEDTLFKAGWPYITQLSMTIKNYRDNFKESSVVESLNFFIKPEYPESKYAEEAQKLTGISYGFLQVNGVSMEYALNHYIAWLLSVDFVVAHNSVFDMKMLKAECLRHKFDIHMRVKPWVDTMYHGTEWMRSVGLTRSRYIKLGLLYQTLTGHAVEDSHKADADVTTTIACFEELASRHVITDSRMKLRILQNQEKLKEIESNG